MNEAKRKKMERLRGLISKDAPVTFQHGLMPGSLPENKSEKYIGVYLQQKETGEVSCASDRIRGMWIIKNSPNMELFDPNKDYEVVIFHLPTPAIAKYGRFKILDICDKVWERNLQEFKTLIEPIDAIIVPTEQLKIELSKVTDKNIYVIGDGHDFSHYGGSVQNQHQDTGKEVVWFGYSQNAACLAPFINYIKTMGLKLKVICQDQNTYPLEHADIFVPWNANTYISEISKSDFALLPDNKDYKSNNKEISALLCGIPVAKTKEDISRFMDPVERKKEVDARYPEIAKHSAQARAAEYMQIIKKLTTEIRIKPLLVYSSICGRFDKPRKDVIVFSDKKSDIFRLPVMNAKIYKVLAHKYIDSQISMYVDGNIFLNTHPSKLVDELLQNADMAVFKHPWRDCLYQEHAHAQARVLPEYRPLMDEQVARYKHEGMPANFGLAECGMIIRRHNAATEEFNERWWAEICRYTNRDQMSFPYVLWKMKDRIKVNFIQGNVRKHDFFKYVNH